MSVTIDYENIVDDIIDQIEAYPSSSFSHVDRVDWIDAEGTFAKGAKDRTFSVLVEELNETEDYASEGVANLSINIQFALSGKNNKYVKHLGYCQEAVLSLEDLEGDTFRIEQVKPYYVNEVVEDIIRVEFDNVMFLIETE